MWRAGFKYHLSCFLAEKSHTGSKLQFLHLLYDDQMELLPSIALKSVGSSRRRSDILYFCYYCLAQHYYFGNAHYTLSYWLANCWLLFFSPSLPLLPSTSCLKGLLTNVYRNSLTWCRVLGELKCTRYLQGGREVVQSQMVSVCLQILTLQLLLYVPWASDLMSLCLCLFIGKMRIIIVPPPHGC